MRDSSNRVIEQILAGAAREELGAVRMDAIGPDCMANFGRFDWQSFVPVPLRASWPQLSEETRIAVYLCAQQSTERCDPSI